jgi:hypothetical protein
MAIVHPAFCGVRSIYLDPIRLSKLTLRLPWVADTKHCKNRMYSAGTAGVLSSKSGCSLKTKTEAHEVERGVT